MVEYSSEELFHKKNISEESDVPLYFQIMSLIKQYILSDRLKPGDMIPSEKELCSIYEVSRSTIRQALNMLAEENFIIRKRGRGTFIASKKIHRNLNHLYSFTDDMKSMNLKPYSRVLEQTVEKASESISGSLNINTNTKVFKLTRLRYANDEPLLLESTYIPLYLCPDILNVDFKVNSLYNLLRSKYNLILDRAIETYESIKMDADVARLFKCKKSSPGFSIHRVAYMENGIPFELTDSIARSDKCMFRVELKADKSHVQFSREINL